MKPILKYTTVLSVLSILLISLTISVFAHPGSLDENGGHYDRSTGEYHYHHGYSAHQHTNGQCPYDFKDNVDDDYTPNNNSSSNNITKTEPTTRHQINPSTKASIFTIIKNWFSRNSTNIFCFWMYFICIPLCVIFVFILFIKKEPPTWLYITEGVAWAIALLLMFLSNS